jgi:hypothetical protein
MGHLEHGRAENESSVPSKKTSAKSNGALLDLAVNLDLSDND